MNVMEKVLREKIDPMLSKENLSTIASQAIGKSVRVQSARILTGGCWNRLIDVELDEHSDRSCPGGLVFKISSEIGNTGIKRECNVLEYFEEHTNFPVPHPFLLDDSGSPIPGTVLVMERVAGKVLHHAYSFLSLEKRESLADQLARAVGRLHEKRSIGFGGVEEDERRLEGWGDFWIPRFDNVFEEVRQSGLVPDNFLDDIYALRNKIPQILSIGGESTLLHYDIWSGNIMITLEKDRPVISGFIDVGGYWGDYARELSFMELFGMASVRFYDIYREYHPLDEGFEIRKNLYNLKMNLKHITMYPDEPYYRIGAEDCLQRISMAL
jgi:fructosamine-3-kinase